MKLLRTKTVSLEEGSQEMKEQNEGIEKQLVEEKSKVDKLEKEKASFQATIKEKMNCKKN